ncbi:MAG: phage tail tape measure protein, partial [Desulfobacterales bacterium]|nr:phage tail tape measure protein [Desulfobacterales bacterium]
ARGAGGQFGFFNKNTKSSIANLKQLLAALAVAKTIEMLVRFGSQARAASKMYETALGDMGKVTDRELGKINAEIMKMPTVLGGSTALMAGYYQTISAGVTEPAAAIGMLTEASKAANAAHIETADTIRGATKMMAGFAGEIDQAAVAFDKIFTIERLGQTSFQELIPYIGEVSTVSRQAGASVDEMGAALALITQTAGSTAQATTQYKAILFGIMKPQKLLRDLIAATGYESGQAMVAQLGLGGALKTIENAAAGAGVPLERLFESQEAAMALAALGANNYERYSQNIAEMGQSAGAAEKAFSNWSKTSEALDQTWKNTVEKIMITFGNEVMPEVNKQIKNIIDLIEENPDLIQGMATAFGAIVKVVGELITAVPKLIGAMNNMTLSEMLFGPKEEQERALAAAEMQAYKLGNIPFRLAKDLQTAKRNVKHAELFDFPLIRSEASSKLVAKNKKALEAAEKAVEAWKAKMKAILAGATDDHIALAGAAGIAHGEIGRAWEESADGAETGGRKIKSAVDSIVDSVGQAISKIRSDGETIQGVFTGDLWMVRDLGAPTKSVADLRTELGLLVKLGDLLLEQNNRWIAQGREMPLDPWIEGAHEMKKSFLSTEAAVEKAKKEVDLLAASIDGTGRPISEVAEATGNYFSGLELGLIDALLHMESFGTAGYDAMMGFISDSRQGLADFFNVMNDGWMDWGDLSEDIMESVARGFSRLMGQMAQEAILNPIIIQTMGGFGAGGYGGAAQGGGFIPGVMSATYGQAQQQPQVGGVPVGGPAGDLLSQFSTTISDIMAYPIFSASNMGPGGMQYGIGSTAFPGGSTLSLGGALGTFGLGSLGYSMFGELLGLPMGPYSGIGAGLGSVAGQMGGMALGTYLGGGAATAAAAGAGAVAGLSGGLGGGAGAAAGAGAGASGGSWAGPAGAVIGALLGGALASLFGGDDRKARAEGHLRLGDDYSAALGNVEAWLAPEVAVSVASRFEDNNQAASDISSIMSSTAQATALPYQQMYGMLDADRQRAINEK